MRLPRMTTRRLMIEVAFVGVVLGLLVAAYREGNRQLNLVRQQG